MERDFGRKAKLWQLLQRDNDIDWREAQRHINSRYNELHTIIADSDNAILPKRLERFYEDLTKSSFGPEFELSFFDDLPDEYVGYVLAGESPAEGGRRIADLLTSVCVGPLDSWHKACLRAEDRVQMTRIVFALTKYRSEHGVYPTTLSGLAPQYIETVGSSKVTNDRFYYRRSSGFTLSNVAPERVRNENASDVLTTRDYKRAQDTIRPLE